MYVIAIYDVDSKRDPKVMKVLRKYIFRIHNSVFEGELTPSQLDSMKEELKKIGYEGNDSVIVYKTLSKNSLMKEAIVGERSAETILLG